MKKNSNTKSVQALSIDSPENLDAWLKSRISGMVSASNHWSVPSLIADPIFKLFLDICGRVIANAELLRSSTGGSMNTDSRSFTSDMRSTEQLQRPRRQLRALRRLRRSFLSIKIHALPATEHGTQIDVQVRFPLIC